MKEIKLTQGQFTKVDDEDYQYLNQWKWHCAKCKDNYRACRNITIGKKIQKRIYMSHIIMEPKIGFVVDHIDHNTLNNQRSNLRICSRKQNARNYKSKKGTSIYIGVNYIKKGKRIKRWCSSIRVNYKLKTLGIYKTEKEAALRRDEAAKYYFGEYACLNFYE